MAKESLQKKKARVRPPRVHIEYEVETEDAVIVKDLPFVVGVMGDFSGNPSEPLQSLKDRKFTQIDRYNFDDVMAKIKPELNLRVKNTLEDDGSELALQLLFKSMDDFDPNKVAQQVPALKKLLETREKLRDLALRIDRSPELEKTLEQILSDDELRKQVSQVLGKSDTSDDE
ncbi:MAG: type VI secretion system contractile sheath small subunit [Pirellulales bacterium]|nr:type VI secretion system contractile sheath small subunit [Pirellulales bacterium]